MKRHLEKHRKVEASLEVAESLQHEAYAPIEITPTKVHRPNFFLQFYILFLVLLNQNP